MQEKKLDLIFGSQKKDEHSFNIYKEELVYWNSQNTEMLGYSKKEAYAELIKDMIKQQAGRLNQNISLSVDFSSDLKRSFTFFDEHSLQKVFTSFGGLFAVLKDKLKTVAVFVESEQISLELKLDVLTEKLILDRGLENFATLFKLKTAGPYFNAVKYTIKTDTDGIFLKTIFSSKILEKSIEKSRQGRGSEKRHVVQTF